MNNKNIVFKRLIKRFGGFTDFLHTVIKFDEFNEFRFDDFEIKYGENNTGKIIFYKNQENYKKLIFDFNSTFGDIVNYQKELFITGYNII